MAPGYTPEAVRKPQAIDGEDGANPSLCRNRVGSDRRQAPDPQSEYQPERLLNRAASHCPIRQYTMTEKQVALPVSASRVVLAIALAGSCAFAQSPGEAEQAAPADAAELPPVTVSAHNGQAVPYNHTGVSVSILDVDKKRNEGTTSLSDALTDTPGVYIIPGGGDYQRGNVASITIRGMSAGNDVMPMVDGMRMTNTSTNLTQNLMARLNLFDLDNVEVLKGPQGAVYGGGSMGGVIYMETPKGQGEPSLTLFNEAGSFDSYTGNARAQGEIGPLAFFLSTTYTRTNNDTHFADGTEPKIKHNSHYENWQEALRLDYTLNESNVFTLTFRREDAICNYPTRDSLSRYDFRSNLVTAKWQSQITDRYRTSLMLGYYGLDNNLSMPNSPYYTALRNFQLEWRNAFEWNDQHTTTAGFSWQRSDYSVKSGSPLVRDTSSGNLENTYNLFAEHTYRPIDTWDNTLALRLENSDIYGSHFTFRAASAYRFNQERTRIFASVGTGYRAPSSFQRSGGAYVGPWGTYHGNPDLDCEQSISADLGIEQQITQRHSISATFFWQQKRDAIDTLAVYDPATWQTDYYYANSSGHWTVQGVELALQGKIEDTWNTGYRLCCTLAQPTTSADAQIPSTARQTWSAEIYTSPFKGLTTGFGLVAAAGRSSFYSGSNHIDGYYTLRWFARYEVNEHLAFHLRVENITNQKFVTAAGYPTPLDSYISAGTAVYGGCTVTF